MKPEILKSEQSLLKLKFKPFDQGILNLIRKELWTDKATQMAGYRVTHPEIGHVEFTLRTKGKKAKQVWNDAIARVVKHTDSLKKELKSL